MIAADRNTKIGDTLLELFKTEDFGTHTNLPFLKVTVLRNTFDFS